MTGEELEKIYKECYKSVFWTANSLLKNKDDAEDIVQDTFKALFESYDEIRDKSKVEAWLKKTAANKCLNKLTRNRTVNVEDEFFEEIEAIPEDFLPESLVEVEESRRTVMNIIENSLSEDIRRTLILYYFDEMTGKEIAEALGVPLGTVLWRLNYAKKKLKTEVEQYEKKSGTKLFMVPLPFLTRLFIEEAKNVTFKPISPQLSAKANGKSAKKGPAGTVTRAATNGAKLTGMKAVVLSAIGVVSITAAVIVGVNVVNNMNNKNNPGSVSTQSTEMGNTTKTGVRIVDFVAGGTAETEDMSILADNEFYRLKVIDCDYNGGKIRYTAEVLNKTDDTDLRLLVREVDVNRWRLRDDEGEKYYWSESIPKGKTKTCSFEFDCADTNVPESATAFMDLFSCTNTVASEDEYKSFTDGTQPIQVKDVNEESMVYSKGEHTERVDSAGLPEKFLIDNEKASLEILNVSKKSSGIEVTAFVDSKEETLCSSLILQLESVYGEGDNHVQTVCACPINSKAVITFMVEDWILCESGTPVYDGEEFDIVLLEGFVDEVGRQRCRY